MPSKVIGTIVFIVLIVLIVMNVRDAVDRDVIDTAFEELKNITIEDGTSVVVASSTRSIAGEHYSVAIDFPVTNNEKINVSIQDFVVEIENNFVNDVEAFDIPRISNHPYSLTAWFETYQTERYVSIVFLIATDVGGAHPSYVYNTKLFTLEGEYMTIEDLLGYEFPDTTIDILARYARDSLYEQLGEDAQYGWINDGTEPALENFQDFYLTETELVLLFEPYTVGPYAWSSQEVRLPVETLRIVHHESMYDEVEGGE